MMTTPHSAAPRPRPARWIAAACLALAAFLPAPAPAQNAPATPPSGGGEEVNFTILREPDGEYVAHTDFLEVLRRADASAGSSWQNVQGVLRLTVSGHEFQIFEKRPVLIMDGQQQVMPRALRVKRGAILLPLESVNAIFKAVGIEIQGMTPPAAATPANVAAPVDATASPATVPAVSGVASPPGPMSTPGSLFASPVTNPTPLPALETPSVGPGNKGITWADLVDPRHQNPPRKITLVADAELARLSDRLKAMLDSGLQVQTSVVEARSRRGGALLVERVRGTQPELVVDLMLGPDEGSDAFTRGSLEVWSVHEALWPANYNQMSDPINSYLPHQFHNLALGSMLRGELSRSFPAYEVKFELSPSYLLRRVDAPSVAVVIPPSVFGRGQEVDYIARSIAAAVMNYYNGVQAARAR